MTARSVCRVTVVPLAIALAWASTAADLGEDEWVSVDYGRIVDARRLTHSGESVEVLLQRLQGRSLPPPGERPVDALTHRLLDPWLERHAFVLPDVLDHLHGVTDPPHVEVGFLWQPGERQPAWVELLRARQFVVESDGEGRMRACLPWKGGPGIDALRRGRPATPSVEAGREAWESAWSVMRHVVAAERRRMEAAGGPGERPVEIEVHPYVHDPARTGFVVGARPYRIVVSETRPSGRHAPIDLAAFERFLDRGMRLEGARLDDDGNLRLLGSESDTPPTLLGHPLSLADLAVAYRAIFRGGLGEPYMSLDRADAPHDSVVNYGGRLRDTSLGLVSLLCDVRFKTFSLGIDVLEGADVRNSVRETLPGFRTHLERFAADPGSAGISGQQTRLWFYPDDVDLTLSEQGDVLVLRRARMTAASERVEDGASAGGRGEDPPWTRATIAAINREYDALATLFPELDDLDRVVRLLSLFTWLRLVGAEGQALPELDALLAVELPARPTPRRFPQLLAFNALPASGEAGAVTVVERAEVGEALGRLESPEGHRLPARERFRRALAALDRTRRDHAELASELEAYDVDSLADSVLDFLSYRAERLRMHQLVLTTLPAEERDGLAARGRGGERLRVFSVGIGGLDLGMDQALASASRRGRRIGWGGQAEPERTSAPRPRAVPPTPERTGGDASREEWRADPPGLPETRIPAHGVAACAERDPCRFGSTRLTTGTVTVGDAEGSFVELVTGEDGPDPRRRRIEIGPDRRVRRLARFEGGRTIEYRFEREGGRLRAVPDPVPTTSSPRPQPGLAEAALVLEALPSPAGSPAVSLTLRFEGAEPLAAAVPRPLLQRLVLGRRLDRTPDRPLPGLAPLPERLGAIRDAVVMQGPDERRPPWDGSRHAVPGEQDAARLARALRAWWRDDPTLAGVRVVVGTDPERSVARLRRAPRPGKDIVLLVPDDGLPPPWSGLREEIGSRWVVGDPVRELPAKPGTTVVVISGEAPALLGARLRRLAREPSMSGRLLAVYSLSGPVRGDLPASLLAEGKLAGVGLADAPPVHRGAIVRNLEELAAGLERARRGRLPVESAGDLFVWFY